MLPKVGAVLVIIFLFMGCSNKEPLPVVEQRWLDDAMEFMEEHDLVQEALV